MLHGLQYCINLRCSCYKQSYYYLNYFQLTRKKRFYFILFVLDAQLAQSKGFQSVTQDRNILFCILLPLKSLNQIYIRRSIDNE